MEKIVFRDRSRKWLALSFLLLTACSSSVLPDKPANLADFIPQEIVAEETVEESEFNFVEKNFPDNCIWEKFERVVDGDTIVTENFRVRMTGIDTPETKHPTKPIQKFGLESTAFADEFFKNAKKVCLIESTVGDKFDKYSRKLAYVFSEDGRDYNVEVMQVGLARGYFYFPFDRKAEFQQIEKMAKAKGVNLWQ